MTGSPQQLPPPHFNAKAKVPSQAAGHRLLAVYRLALGAIPLQSLPTLSENHGV